MAAQRYLAFADALLLATKVVTAIIVAIMLVTVNVAVVYRYVFHSPIYWADELVVSLMVWVSFLGASLAVAARMQYGFEGLVGLLPRFLRLPVVIATQAGVIILFLVYIVMGFQALPQIADQYLPSSGFSVVTVYAALPIGVTLMLIEQFAQYLRRQGPDEGEGDTL